MIHILSPEVANRIAAGEVVERPASVVRELIDNAVDAGATRVDVEVEDGGLALIRVTDNGGGMSPEDTALSVKRHATSKITHSEDLAHILTKGFRGEALAAISSVAKFEVRTRRAEDELGSMVLVEGGREMPPKPVGTPVGTSVSVRELFYNVPARRKFLKKPATELAQILATITWNALSHEWVHFTFSHNGRRTLDYPGVSNRPERIQQIFGKEILADLIPVHLDSPFLSITGFISRPTLTRNNAQSIFFFVNDRYIKDKLLHTAMMNGYRSLIPHGRYPVVFLYYEIAPGEIDINVHPTKQEIKFSREDTVFGATYRAIRQAWDTREDPAADTLPPPADEATLFEKEREKPAPAGSPAPPARPEGFSERPAVVYPPRTETMLSTPRIQSGPADVFPTPSPSRPNEAPGTSSRPAAGPTPPPVAFPGSAKVQPLRPGAGSPPAPEAPPSDPVSALNRKTLNPVLISTAEIARSTESALQDLMKGDKKPEDLFSVQSLEGAGSLTVLGQLMNSYILAESAEGLFIIDQHAAHERLKFEEFLHATHNAPLASQTMLFPITVDLAPEEIAVVEENLDLLEQFGFQVEPFGPRTFVIRSIPSSLRMEEAEDFIKDLLSEIKMEGSTQDKRDKMLQTMACRAAVKFGDPLSTDEMKAILKGLESIPRRNVCPHGRPSILYVADITLRRLFKRMGF